MKFRRSKSVWCLILVLTMPTAAMAEKRVALTYDDAPRSDGQVYTGAERATALMEALASVDAGPVAFFVTTRGFDQNKEGRERIARYAAAGHLIANHTHTHPWAHKTVVADYLIDVDQAIVELEGFDNFRPWFRFPYLDEGRSPEKVKAIAEALTERGLANGYVTIDNYDWYLDGKLQEALKAGHKVDYEALGKLYVNMLLYSAEYYDSVAVQTLGESPVHVLLLHENDLAAMFADELVAAFRKNGWEIVSPDVAYEDPLPVPSSLRTGQGRVVALANDAGRAPTTMWTWAIDEQMIDVQIERSSAFGAAK
ncbi:MAG: polysaccharide deacetylase family protein [Pseudomonadota bacterium]